MRRCARAARTAAGASGAPRAGLMDRGQTGAKRRRRTARNAGPRARAGAWHMHSAVSLGIWRVFSIQRHTTLKRTERRAVPLVSVPPSSNIASAITEPAGDEFASGSRCLTRSMSSSMSPNAPARRCRGSYAEPAARHHRQMRRAARAATRAAGTFAGALDCGGVRGARCANRCCCAIRGAGMSASASIACGARNVAHSPRRRRSRCGCAPGGATRSRGFC